MHDRRCGIVDGYSSRRHVGGAQGSSRYAWSIIGLRTYKLLSFEVSDSGNRSINLCYDEHAISNVDVGEKQRWRQQPVKGEVMLP
jgi:hypothetical protein